jgi:hypothetical protein
MHSVSSDIYVVSLKSTLPRPSVCVARDRSNSIASRRYITYAVDKQVTVYEVQQHILTASVPVCVCVLTAHTSPCHDSKRK